MATWRVEVVRLDHGRSNDQGNHPTQKAVVLALNPDFTYGKSPADWKDNAAAPIWNLTKEGVDQPAKLQKVSNFNPQVAGDTQRDALLATAVSIVLIMIYIWFRFGDMKYATAVVVALVHDTIAVVGAIGL